MKITGSLHLRYRDKKYLLFFFLFFFLLVFFSTPVPFFWDMINYSAKAQYYFSSNFSDLIAPCGVDDGHPPLFPLYIALAWKISGKSLAVCHWAMLPVMLGIIWETNRLASRFLSRRLRVAALILVLADPVLLTQCVLFGQDLFIIYFFLLSLNSILYGKKKSFAVASSLLAMTSMRGIMLMAPLILWNFSEVFFIEKKKWGLKDFLPFLPAALVVIAWGLFHYSRTGWLYSDPEKARWLATAASPAKMVKNFVNIIWKILDFGRFTLWLVPALLLSTRKLKTDRNYITLAILTLSLFLTFVFFMVPISNPICHRYFISINIIAAIAAVYQIQFIRSTLARRLAFGMLLLAILSGNFYLYPEHLKNGWDASLKALPYFSLKNRVIEYVKENNIDPGQVATGFPLSAPSKYTDLAEVNFSFRDKDTGSLRQFPYVIQSNVCNDFTPSELDTLRSGWPLVREFASGQVYIRLYRNPEK